MLNALDRLASGYAADCDRVERDLNLARSQLRDYQGNLNKPFVHDRYLSKLTALRDQLKAGLSGNSHEEARYKGPSVVELAEHIKALKAANTIEATPQRVASKQASAEEPISVRVRKRQEASTEQDQAAETLAHSPGSEATTSPAPTKESCIKPWRTFQERIATERRRNDLEPSPP